MKFHYAGKYINEESFKEVREAGPDAVMFREPEHKAFALIANIGSFALLIILALIILPFIKQHPDQFKIGVMVSLLTLVPHEFLHAICFRKDVYMYTNLSKGLLFVYGTEDMSKAHFVFMSLLPNLVFGLIPYILVFINHDLVWLGMMGAMCLGMGFGDYINVFNAITQMPKGSKTFLCKMHSYWYKP